MPTAARNPLPRWRSRRPASAKSFGETRAVDGVDLAVRTRLGLRRPRPQRRRQDDHDPDARDAAAPRRGRGPRARPRHRPRRRRGPRGGQPHRAARLGRRGPDRAREPDPDRAPARAQAAGGEGPGDELLEAFGLSEAAGRLVKNYSGGMRRRLDIAASIVVTPQLMFLDEPTTGLDPRSRNQVWDIIRSLRRRGHDDPALHPVPRRGRPARRRDRRDRPRQGDRRGDAGTAQGLGRRAARCTCGCSIPSSARRPSGCSRASSATVHLEPDPAALSVSCADAGARRRGGRASSAAPGSGSPTSRSASRASTRSSWRSPVSPPRTSRPREPRSERSRAT